MPLNINLPILDRKKDNNIAELVEIIFFLWFFNPQLK